MNALILAALLAQAQAPIPDASLSHADLQFELGWQNLHKDLPSGLVGPHDQWLNGIFYGGAGVGWYWNDHLKTQVDGGAGTRATQYLYSQNSTSFESSRVHIREANLSVSQQYQFFRNEWFHPHVGAGLEFARETKVTDHDPIYVYDSIGRISREVVPAHTDPAAHRFIARPFVEVGFKAYMTRRAFFLGDSRVLVRSGIDEVLFRCGFGVDF